MPTEIPRSSHVGFSSENFAQFGFHCRHIEQGRHVIRVVLKKNVDIAVGTKSVGQDRTEKRQLGQVMPPTKSLNGTVSYRYRQNHLKPFLSDSRMLKV